MAERNEELGNLYQQMLRKAELEATAASLREKRKVLLPEVKQRKRAAKAEQRDVNRLERPSVAALVSHITGKREQQLESERREAEEAQAQYEAAGRELEETEARLRDVETRLSAIDDCRERFVQLLEQKRAAIKAAGGADTEKILGKERTLTFLESQLRAIAEATAAGKTAWGAVGNVLSFLETAALRTGLACGKGLVNDLASLSDSLPNAQSAVYSLKQYITDFEKKLAMTSVRGKLNFRPEDVDVWNPGLIRSSTASGSKIRVAKEKLESLQQRIALLLEQLSRETEQVKRKLQKNREALERMLVNMDWSE